MKNCRRQRQRSLASPSTAIWNSKFNLVYQDEEQIQVRRLKGWFISTMLLLDYLSTLTDNI